MKETDAVREVDGGLREMLEWDWSYSTEGHRLHHVAEGDVRREWDGVPFDATTTCGRTGKFMVPGLFSRMGMPRCNRCCDRLGWPRGTGSPKNDDTLRPLVEARLAGSSAEPRTDPDLRPQET